MNCESCSFALSDIILISNLTYFAGELYDADIRIGRDYLRFYYTDFVESKHSHNTGTLHKGNNSRNMDKWNKFNHEEYKTHKNIDKKNK